MPVAFILHSTDRSRCARHSTHLQDVVHGLLEAVAELGFDQEQLDDRRLARLPSTAVFQQLCNDRSGVSEGCRLRPLFGCKQSP